MPERKNQHYVPQHYLEAWSSNNKINTLHIPSEGIFREDIQKVCSRNYFYGKPHVEDELVHLEGHHATSLNKLRDGATLPNLSLTETRLLLSFVTTQRTRTRATKLDIQSEDDLLREGVKEDLEANRYDDLIDWKEGLTDKDKEDALVDASVLGIHHRLMVQGIFGYISIGDLEGVMLCNVTNREFLISDSPIVHDNPRYKSELGMVRAGLGNRGLQIYCPIDPNRILLLYDPAVYSFDHNSKKQVLIRAPEVADQLNLLQFHNAESIVMFDSSSDDYIKDLFNRIDDVRRRDEITVNQDIGDGETVEITQVPYHQIPLTSPDLPNASMSTGLEYVQRRPTSKVQEQQKLVNSIFKECFGASDLAVIFSIRLLQKKLGLQ